MKFGYAIILFSFFVIISCNEESDSNIYDYYLSLPEVVFSTQDLDHTKYDLVRKNNTWYATSVSGQTFSPVVDIKNGYIEINDEGTGGGNIYQQIVLFEQSDSSPIIAITKGGFNGFYFDSSTAFYEKSGNIWVENSNVFPELNIQRFLNSRYREFNFKKDEVVTPNLTTLIHLYRDRKVVKVEPNFNKFDFLIESNQNVLDQKSFTETEAEKLWEIIEHISIESFILKFDIKTGRFIIQDSVSLNQNTSKLSLEKENTAEFTSEEQVILDRLWQMKEVKELANYIDSASAHTRNLKMVFEGHDEENPQFQRIHAVEDNGGNLVTHLIFNVKNDASEVYLYDAIKDEYIRRY